MMLIILTSGKPQAARSFRSVRPAALTQIRLPKYGCVPRVIAFASDHHQSNGTRYCSPPALHRRTRCAHWVIRSEEHTSELQSQSNLVCRLLLEKKKKNKSTSLIQKKKKKQNKKRII